MTKAENEQSLNLLRRQKGGYGVAVRICAIARPNPVVSQICKLQVDCAQESILSDCKSNVYDLYRELGGGDKDMKRQRLSDALREKLCAKFAA